jgi:cytochrome c
MGPHLLRVALGLALLAGALPAAQAQAGDAVRGRGLFESRCGGCHSLDEHRVGPALGNVVGRAAGRRADFAYSAALARASHVWTPEKLQAWLTDPEALVPGQAMGYRLSEPADRRDVIAFLQSLTAGPPAR